MTTDERLNEARKTAECMRSLVAALEEAGGTPTGVFLKMEKMTAMDFVLSILAPNGIRFVFEKPADME